MYSGAGCLILDGPTGTELVARGYRVHPELWTGPAALERPDLLLQVHRDYLNAGADILTAHTFRTSSYAAAQAGLDAGYARRLTRAAVALCQQAQQEWQSRTGVPGRHLIAGSLAPLEDCYHPERVPATTVLDRVHGETAAWLQDAGCDLILAETMGTEREAVSAVRAARRSGVPGVLCSFITDETGYLLLGGEPLVPAARAVLSEGAAGVLINCVHADVLDQALLALASLPGQGVILGAYPNASRMRFHQGEPEWEPDRRPAEEQAQDLARRAAGWARDVRAQGRNAILGSCCGTGPEHIRHLALACERPSSRTADSPTGGEEYQR